MLRRAVPDRRPSIFPLEGRSLTLAELGEVLFTCLDRRVGAMGRLVPWPDQTKEEIHAELAEEIAYVEARRMLERVVAGEPWADIRASVVGDRAVEG
jgi:hypothetical protein